ncbi:MAG: ATP-binding protein [Raineya sp.]|jgi:signal transduction histidine kinase|nr:ATP-binding protein [Raineya sp.]
MQSVGYRYFLLILILFFNLFSSKAQSEYWKSLEEKWNDAPSNSKEKLTLSIALSQELADEQIELATFYAKEALKILENNVEISNDLRGDVYITLTEIYGRKRHQKEAIFYLEKSKKHIDTTSNKFICRQSFIQGLFTSPLKASKTIETHLSKQQPENVELGLIYLEYATNQLRQKNYEKSIEYVEKAEKIFVKFNKIKYLARCYNNKGLVYKNMHLYILSIENYIKAVKLYRSINVQSRNLSITYLNLGNIYIIRPQDTFYYKSAREAYLKSLEIAEKIKDTTQIISTYERLGSLSLLSKDAQKAMVYFSKGFDLSKKIQSAHYQDFLNTRLAKAYFDSGNIQKAEAMLLEVIKNTRNKEDIGMFIDASSILADNYQGIKEYKKSIKILDDAIEIATKNDLKLFLMGFYNRQAINFIQLNRLNEAEKCLSNIENLRDLTDKNILQMLYQNHKQIDSAKGNYLKALEWNNKYIRLTDSLNYTERMRGFAELQQKFEIEEKELILQKLKTQNEQEIANNKRNQNLIVILVLAFSIVASLGVVLWFNQKKLKEKNHKIIAQENDLRNFSEKLTVVNKELTKKHEFDNILLTIISHDLKGPIQSVKTLLEMMQNGVFKPENYQNLLDLATVSLNSSSSLLENILFWAKSYQNDFQMKNKEVNLKDLCERTIGLLALQAEQKGITLENQVSDDVTCYADEDILSLTIRNLISNAIKFTLYGKVTIDASYNKGYCYISVTDTGVGIAPENLNKIFSRQYYTKGTHKEKGTGLGLMLCKEFVERNKGAITVESKVGEGSTFTIQLPMPHIHSKKLELEPLK